MPATLFLSRRGVLVALVAIATPLRAQDSSSLRAWSLLEVDLNAPVRVVTRGSGVTEGRLTSQTLAHVTLHRADGDTTISTRDIDVVDAEVAHRHVLAGLGIGALSGILTGLVVGGASAMNCHGELCGIGIIILPPALGLVGSVVGLIAGATQKTYAWERLETAPR